MRTRTVAVRHKIKCYILRAFVCVETLVNKKKFLVDPIKWKHKKIYFRYLLVFQGIACVMMCVVRANVWKGGKRNEMGNEMSAEDFCVWPSRRRRAGAW